MGIPWEPEHELATHVYPLVGQARRSFFDFPTRMGQKPAESIVAPGQSPLSFSNRCGIMTLMVGVARGFPRDWGMCAASASSRVREAVLAGSRQPYAHIERPEREPGAFFLDSLVRVVGIEPTLCLRTGF
jgi:hypothetical protein